MIFNLHLRKLYLALGFKGQKLPDGEVLPQAVVVGVNWRDDDEKRTVRIWVKPKWTPELKTRRYFHRVMLECPKCSRWIPFGREWHHNKRADHRD